VWKSSPEIAVHQNKERTKQVDPSLNFILSLLFKAVVTDCLILIYFRASYSVK